MRLTRRLRSANSIPGSRPLESLEEWKKDLGLSYNKGGIRQIFQALLCFLGNFLGWEKRTTVITNIPCATQILEGCTDTKLFIGSEVQSVFCLEICTPEWRGEEKVGNANVKTKHTEPLTS